MWRKEETTTKRQDGVKIKVEKWLDGRINVRSDSGVEWEKLEMKQFNAVTPRLTDKLIQNLSRVPAEEDRWGRVRGDLRGLGPADAGERGAEGGVGPAAETGAEDGGGGAEEAAG